MYLGLDPNSDRRQVVKGHFVKKAKATNQGRPKWSKNKPVTGARYNSVNKASRSNKRDLPEELRDLTVGQVVAVLMRYGK